MLQKCLKCNRKFKYKDIFKSIMLSYKAIKCPQCKVSHKMTTLSRIIFALTLPLPILLFNYINKYVPLSPLIIYFIWVTLIVVLSPFFVKFKIENPD